MKSTQSPAAYSQWHQGQGLGFRVLWVWGFRGLGFRVSGLGFGVTEQSRRGAARGVTTHFLRTSEGTATLGLVNPLTFG